MNNSLFKSTCRKGLKRTIRSRKYIYCITPGRFDNLNIKYFQDIEFGNNFQIKSDEEDLIDLIFLFRYGFRLWIDITENEIEVFHTFPQKYELTKEVTPKNHPHTPKSFFIGQKMYLKNDPYNTCNWMKGIPLWNKAHKRSELSESCQINYDFIRPVFSKISYTPK